MKYCQAILATCVSCHILLAQPPIEVEIVGTPADHQVQWTSRNGFVYRVEASQDLAQWTDIGIELPGNGGLLAHGFQSQDDRWFYRIHESVDIENSAFLTRPTPGQEIVLPNGVSFAFDLDVLEDLPAAVKIYKRTYPSGSGWQEIGNLTEFADVGSIRFHRGSAVWVPDAQGDFEVKVTAFDTNGSVIGNAIRLVTIVGNTPPSVTITSGPPTSSEDGQDPVFSTSITDIDGDAISRVEFFDGGILIGTDYAAPFGDLILNPMGILCGQLLRGSHLITARAIDSNGGVSQLSAAYAMTVSGGNAQPAIVIDSPPDGTVVQIGSWLPIYYSVSDADGIGEIASVRVDDLNLREAIYTDYEAPFEYPYNTIYINTTGMNPGRHRFAVVATDVHGDTSYFADLTILIEGAGVSASALVAAIVDEVSATATNPEFIGAPASSAIFSDGLVRGLLMDAGVVMTSGYGANWNNGDVSESTTTAWGVNGDLVLQDKVTGVTTHDAAVLEFDLFCPNGQLVFEYQFATEEYDEYVSQFNDAFLITVDGTPVSLVPEGDDIVGVQSINLSTNRHLFLGDDEDILPLVDEAYRSSRVEYDGMTRKLRANAFLIPNRAYRVKIVVADVNDSIYDAGLFLESASVRTVQP